MAFGEIPQYKCFKTVRALKIKAIELLNDGRARITPEEDGFSLFIVDAEYVSKHNPQAGGYYVVYDDGYTSWSPAKAFEEGYRPLPAGMDFGEAIRAMEEGKRVSRRKWNGPDQWLAIQVPDEHSKMRKPYIYISPVDGEFVPWLASQTDMLQKDWYVVN